MPLACLVAAVGLARNELRSRYAMILGLLALQALLFTLFLRVSATGLPTFRPHIPQLTRPTVRFPLEASFGDMASLVGYDVRPQEVSPGETIQLTLYWQAKKGLDHSYTVFTHLLDPTETLQGQNDSLPAQGSLPTTCWARGEYIIDTRDIEIAPGAPSGQYWIETGLYLWQTGDRLPVSGPDGHLVDRTRLGPITVVGSLR
jgi:hypothetical protein